MLYILNKNGEVRAQDSLSEVRRFSNFFSVFFETAIEYEDTALVLYVDSECYVYRIKSLSDFIQNKITGLWHVDIPYKTLYKTDAVNQFQVLEILKEVKELICK